METQGENNKASISRRNALKAGVATGVGAAAFAGPQIGMLGMAPAYAQTCSATVPCAESGFESTNQGAGCGGRVELNTPTPFNGGGIAASVTGNCLGAEITPGDYQNGDAQGFVTFNADAAQGYAGCVVCVDFKLQGGGTPVANVCGGVVTAGPDGSVSATVPLPTVNDGELGNGSLVGAVQVCCSTDLDCLPPM